MSNTPLIIASQFSEPSEFHGFRLVMRSVCRIARSWRMTVGVAALAFLTCAPVQAQVADDTTGVAVAIKLVYVGWTGDIDPDPILDASLVGLNGYQSTGIYYTNDTESPQMIGRLAVGKTYSLNLEGSNVTGVTVQAVPPPGYVMEIEGVAREQYSMTYGNGSVRLRIRPGAGAAPARTGSATSLGTERTLWQVSLGELSNGQSAGAIAFIDVGVASNVASIFSPEGLIYDAPSSEVQVLVNPAGATAPYVPGTIRQIIAPQVCVDVFMGGTAQCELKFYHRAQLGALGSGGTYDFSGDPFVWYFFNQDGVQPNAVRISRDLRNISGVQGGRPVLLQAGQPVTSTQVTQLMRSGTAPDYTWSAKEWYNQGGSAAVQQVRSRTGAAEALTSAIPGQTAALSLARSYSSKPWGEEVQSETLGSTNSVTTAYGYWSTADNVDDQSAAYTRIRSVLRTGGQWEAYEYYDYSDGIPYAGALKRRHGPFNNSDTTVPSLTGHNGTITTYTWQPDAFGRATRLSGSETTVAGVTVAHSTVTYASATASFTGHPNLYLVTSTQQDYSGAGSALTTTTRYFREDAGLVTATDDFFRGLPHSVSRPDGVKQSFAYQRGSWNGSAFSPSANNGVDPASGTFASRTCVITGSTTSGSSYSVHEGYDIDDIGLIDGKSTLQITIRDNYARVVRVETYARSSSAWALVGAVNFDWNFSNQLVKRVTNDSATFNLSAGAIYEASFDGEQLSSDTDEAGIETTYLYDTSGRLDTATRSGSGAIGALATKFVYDGAGHVTQQIVGYGQTQTLTSSRYYDDAGRVQSESSPGPNPNHALTTSYTYNPGSRQVSILLPNGGTRTETAQADGGLQNITGSAVVPEYYTYSVDPSTGNRWQRVNLGTAPVQTTNASVWDSTSLRQRRAEADWFGRSVFTSRYGFNGQSTFDEHAVFESSTGRLTKTTRSGLADTRYGYDALSQPIRSGLDLNANNALNLDGSDRVADSDQYFELFNSAWWLTRIARTYPTAGDSTPVTVSTTRQRLTGFTGNLRSETAVTDVNNITTTQTRSVNRSTKTTLVTTSIPGFDNPKTETYTNGLPTSVTQADGLTYGIGYDALLRRSTSIDPRTGTTTTVYKPNSPFVYQVQDAAGNTVVTYDYDDAGRVIAATNADTKVAYTEYNTFDQVVRTWGGATTPAEFGYNSYGERTTMKTFRTGSNWANSSWPASTGTADWTRWNYDAYSGLLKEKYDAKNLDPVTGQPIAGAKSVSYTYNNRGQTATRTWARGLVTTYAYFGDTAGEPATGELKSTTYSGGATTNVGYTYTRLGQLKTVTDSTGTRSFIYNTGQPLQLDALQLPAYYNSRVLTRQYDGLKRPAGFLLGTAENLTADLTQTHVYNGLGRFDHLDSASSAQASRTFTYGYYPSSTLLASLSIANSAFSSARTYEPHRNLLASIEFKWNNTTSITRYQYVYNGLGQRYTSKQSGDAFGDYGTATYRRNTYSARGELESSADYLGDTPTALGAEPDATAQLPSRNFRYVYDPIGNRSTVSRNGTVGAGTPGTDTYLPNEANQYASRTNNLARAAGTVANDTIAVTASGGSLGWVTGRKGRFWAADAQVATASNPTAAPLTVTAVWAGGGSGGSDVSSSDTSRVALLFPQAQSFEYDDDGNLQADGLWSYAYDGENRLITMTATTGQGSAVAGGFANRILEFKYDYLGRRVQKRSLNQSVSPATETWRRYLYDGDNLVAEFEAPGGTSCSTLLRSYTWGLDLAGSLGATGGVGGLVQITEHTGTASSYFPTYDGNGNVASVVRASDGAIVGKYEYSPFGELLRAEGSYAATNPFRFSTKFTDDESGLVYYGHRYYSPSLGRFINRDPIQEQGGLNLYGFCGNDAINGIDVLGNGNFFSDLWNGTVGAVGKGLKRLEHWTRKHTPGAILLNAATAIFAPWALPITGSLTLASESRQAWHFAQQNPQIAAVVAAIATWYIGGWGAGALGFTGTTQTVIAGASAGFGGGFVGARAAGADLRTAFRAGYQGAAWGGGLAFVGAEAFGVKYTSFTLQSAAHQFATSEVRYEVGRFAENKLGMDAWAFNGALLAASFIGNKLVGEAYLEKDGQGVSTVTDNGGAHGIAGFFSRIASTGALFKNGGIGHMIAELPFDIADTLLQYQGLPDATGLKIMWNAWKPTFGHSLGALRFSNIVGFGAVEGGAAYAEPFGMVAPSGVNVFIGNVDPITGFSLGKLLNWDAQILHTGHLMGGYRDALGNP